MFSVKEEREENAQVQDGIMHVKEMFKWRPYYYILQLGGILFMYKSKERVDVVKKTFDVKKMAIVKTAKQKNTFTLFALGGKKKKSVCTFQCPTASAFVGWYNNISYCGAMNEEYQSLNVPTIAYWDVLHWKEQDLQEYFSTSEEMQYLRDSKTMAKFDGKKLVQEVASGEDVEKKCNIFNEKQKAKLLEVVASLKEKRVFNYGKVEGKKKLAKFLPNPKKFKVDDIANLLTTPKLLLKTYLQMKKFSTEVLLAKSSKSVNDIPDVTVESDGADFSIKIVVNEFALRPGDLSPVFGDYSSAVNIKEEIKLRVSLLVGDFFISWDPTNLVIPKRATRTIQDLFKKDFLFEEKVKGTDKPEVFDKLAKLVCKWNMCMNYSKVTIEDNPSFGNPFDFILEFFDLIDVAIPPTTDCIGIFFKMMREKSELPMEFCPTPQLKKLLALKKDPEFADHSSLDIFVKQKLGALGKGAVQKELKLLSCLDNVFYIRHLIDKDKKEFQPWKCPFERK